MSLALAICLGFSSFILCWAEASKGVTVEGFRYWSSERYTRLVINLNSPAKFTQNRLSNPDRLYFDLENCRLSRKVASSITIKDGILKVVRAAQYKKGTVRVVLELQEIESFNTFFLKDPYRLVIDIYGKTIRNPDFNVKKRTTKVIIDPGHGGKDPGAIGPRGLREKDVVLAVAKRLGKILREKYNMEVVYTRKKDIYVPLEKRTAIANTKEADLFISIHTNASRQKNTRGIETYFLNWTNNREAMRVAARENAISIRNMQETKSGLDWLPDLVRENKKQNSMRLAGNVQKSLVNTLKQDYGEIVDLGVKWALFYVLVGAEMPSVLVEISFISNRKEERLLSKNSYRERIAEAIALGIKNYTAPSRFAKK